MNWNRQRMTMTSTEAAELRHGRIPQLQKELDAMEDELEKEKQESRLLRQEVTEEEIASIVARWTGIPVSKLVESEREKSCFVFRKFFTNA